MKLIQKYNVVGLSTSKNSQLKISSEQEFRIYNWSDISNVYNKYDTSQTILDTSGNTYLNFFELMRYFSTDTKKKSLTFFEDLKIKNLEIYFDSPNTLAKKFKLRGLPTTILFNKDGLEFARIIGSIDFVDEKFIKWLSNFN